MTIALLRSAVQRMEAKHPTRAPEAVICQLSLAECRRLLEGIDRLLTPADILVTIAEAHQRGLAEGREAALGDVVGYGRRTFVEGTVSSCAVRAAVGVVRRGDPLPKKGTE